MCSIIKPAVVRRPSHSSRSFLIHGKQSMALNDVGLLVYSQGFALSRDEYIIRELAFCDWTGHHHALFKYLLPPGMSYHQLSEKAKTRVDRQTRTVHGLPFKPSTVYNRQEFIPTIRSRTISPVGVTSTLPPNGIGSGCSHSMVCIDCCTNPDFRTPRGLGRAGV